MYTNPGYHYNNDGGLGALGFSIGGLFKGIGKTVLKVAESPFKTVEKVGETVFDVATGNFSEAGRDIVSAGKDVLPAAAVAATILGAPIVAPFALGAGKIILGGVESGASAVAGGVRSVVGAVTPVLKQLSSGTMATSQESTTQQPSSQNGYAVNPFASLFNTTTTNTMPGQNVASVQASMVAGIPTPYLIAGAALFAVMLMKRR